jgi:hypothetical protein
VFSVTMRQLSLPERMGGALSTSADAMLRSVSAGVDNRAQIAESVSVRYGASMDSVWFLNRLNYYSPYARLTYSVNNKTDIEFGYSAGNARPDLVENNAEQADLQRDLNTLGLFPRVSMVAGQPQVQRGQEFEASVTHKRGSRSVRLSAYRETLSNTALTMVAPAGMFDSGDVLPDLFSDSSVFNAGRFDMSGYDVALTQNFGPNVSVTAIYGNEGGITATGHELVSNSPDELRSMIRAGRRQAATARISVSSPWTGSHLIASYQWAGDQPWIMAGNLYSTQSLRALPGLNFQVRQPIPGFGKRLEATADIRNLLSQGYLPITTASGARLLLVDNPRSFRGGLAFTF